MVSYSIVLHGGAGSIEKDLQPEFQKGLKTALNQGTSILKNKGSALDAVVAAIISLEDNPLFNAGLGASLTSAGTVELDASLMNGETLSCASISGVKKVKNPILLARKVMENTPYVFLQGESADLFAKDEDLDLVNEEYFITPHRIKQLKKVKNTKLMTLDHMSNVDDPIKTKEINRKMGTVGAVAFDSTGNIVAATSTGGLTNKRPGRVGDSAVIGAGTYAANGVCGVSCTGVGEEYIRHSVAHTVYSLIKYSGLTIDQAVTKVLTEVLPVNSGGIIAIDGKGKVFAKNNTPDMLWISETS